MQKELTENQEMPAAEKIILRAALSLTVKHCSMAIEGRFFVIVVLFSFFPYFSISFQYILIN
jgi:hypothetical protein